MYPPINIRPRRAWHLAKASLRCRRRSLRRQKEKQILTNTSADNPHLGTINETNNPTINNNNNNTNTNGANTITNNVDTGSLQGVVIANGPSGVSQPVQTVIRL